MSPNPRDGFYVVIHFAADGSALFVTVGCGSTIWANGELRAVSDAELKRRTDWARAVVTEAFGTTAPFGDVIRLGARAPLPRTFEKATALARRVPVNELDESSIRDMIIGATARLRCLYEAQRIGRDRSPAEKVEIELENLSRPGRRGQGFGLTGPERKVVEDRAMKLAREWFEEREYVVENTSLTFPFDYRVQKDGRALKVEVKGTTSDFCDAIIMTHNEVKLHREEAGSTALIIVSGIRLERGADGPVAQGGELHADIGWDIGTWDLAPVAYRVSKPTAS
jgi:hypothetical protein